MRNHIQVLITFLLGLAFMAGLVLALGGPAPAHANGPAGVGDGGPVHAGYSAEETTSVLLNFRQEELAAVDTWAHAGVSVQSVRLPDSWLEAEDMPTAFGGPGFVQCPDDPNDFYLLGGAGPNLFQWRNQFYKYHATLNQWTQLSSLPLSAVGVAAACYDGKIYAAGGWRGFAVPYFYIYDLAANAWVSGPNLPRSVSGAALAAWDGKLYLAGGSPTAVPAPPTDRVDMYDIARGTWHPATGPAMPVAASYPGWVQLGQYLYIVGGWSGDLDENVAATQRLDLAADPPAWEAGAAFSSRRAILALAGTGTQLYASGGDANGSGTDVQSALVESLDLSLWPGGAWADLADPLPQEVMGNAGFCTEAMAGGEAWSVGGFYGASPNVTSVDTNLYRTAGPCYDFSFGDLSPENLDGTDLPGSKASYTLTVYNAGTLTDSYTVTVSGNAWTVTVPAEVGPLSPGVSGELVLQVEIPGKAPFGDSDRAQITLISHADPAMADSAVITTTAVPFRGVALAPESQAQPGYPGDTLTYTLHGCQRE